LTVVRYDPATGPSGGPTPGAIAVRDHWRRTTGLGDLGIYNPRPPRGGTGWSVHAEGRAVDLAADALFTAERETADRYCRFLIDVAPKIQCQYLIWNRRSWKSGRGWAAYSGVSPHTDHIHVELNRDGARDVTLPQLNALWSEWTADHTTPQGDDEMVQDVIGFHTAYFGVIPGTDRWNKDIVKSVNWHLWRLTTGQAHLEQVRQDFARTVGI
jgi:hypothetical protein